MATKVKNLNGTADISVPSGYKSWLHFWEENTGRKAGDCGRCINSAEVGAHVKKFESCDNSWYIVPLCRECNAKPSEEEFTVYEDLIPVR